MQSARQHTTYQYQTRHETHHYHCCCRFPGVVATQGWAVDSSGVGIHRGWRRNASAAADIAAGGRGGDGLTMWDGVAVVEAAVIAADFAAVA